MGQKITVVLKAIHSSVASAGLSYVLAARMLPRLSLSMICIRASMAIRLAHRKNFYKLILPLIVVSIKAWKCLGSDTWTDSDFSERLIVVMD